MPDPAWMHKLCVAMARDEAEGFKILARRERASLWRIQIRMAADLGREMFDIPSLAAYLGAYRCLESLAEMAAQDDRLDALEDALERASGKLERGEDDQDGSTATIAAIMRGADRGLEPRLHGFERLRPDLPAFSRCAALAVENLAATAAGLPEADRGRVEAARRICGAIARNEPSSMRVELAALAELREESGLPPSGIDDFERFVKAAICCEAFGCLTSLFEASLARCSSPQMAAELVTALLVLGEELGSSCERFKESQLKSAVAHCVDHLVRWGGRPEFGRFILSGLVPIFKFLGGSVADGVARAVAALEAREFEAELPDISPARFGSRPSLAVRI